MRATEMDQSPVHPPALHPKCTEPASEHPASAFEAASEGSDRFPWGDVEGFDEDGNQYWEHDQPSDYEPSEPIDITVSDTMKETPVDPVSQTSWKRFAQTELVASEVRNLKQARMMSLNDSFLAESPFASMSSMFDMSEGTVSKSLHNIRNRLLILEAVRKQSRGCHMSGGLGSLGQMTT